MRSQRISGKTRRRIWSKRAIPMAGMLLMAVCLLVSAGCGCGEGGEQSTEGGRRAGSHTQESILEGAAGTAGPEGGPGTGNDHSPEASPGTGNGHSLEGGPDIGNGHSPKASPGTGNSHSLEGGPGTGNSYGLVYTGSMELEYAKGFSVDYYEGGYVMLTIKDYGRFLVAEEGSQAPEDLPADVTVLKKPVDHIYLAATAVMDMFRELKTIDRVRFSSQKKEGWYIEEAAAAMEEGNLVYAGKYNTPDYEMILSGGCQLAIENTMILHCPEVKEKLEEFGIPVLIDCSSYEEHPLGRVEWIKLYGALLGEEEEAFRAFDRQCQALTGVEEERTEPKTVAFFYITANGMVNVRHPDDYIPGMVELGGGTYIPAHMDMEGKGRSSVNMTMEEFYKAAKDADYLIYNSTVQGEMRTLEELLDKNQVLEDFKAVREGRVWGTESRLYQQSMSTGPFIEDIHRMLLEEPGRQEHMEYLYPLKREAGQ